MTTTIVCGAFDAGTLSDDVLGGLPRVLVLDSGMARWVEPMFELLSDSEASPSPGAAAVLAKIADVFLTQLLRQYLASDEGVSARAPTVVGSPAIGEALRRMRRDPQAPWTVAILAQAVGMSRTAFAAQFRAAVDESPIAYLARLRLSAGAGYLSTSSRTIGEIARLVGYDNEASFSKAFKRVYGRAPGVFRLEWATGEGIAAV